MANAFFLGILEAAAIASCVWGMYHVYIDSTNILEVVYNGLWFILGFLSNAMGFLSILYNYMDDDELLSDAHWLLQNHYLFAWFTVIIGYPTFVASIWMSHAFGHYSVYWSHGHVGLALIPLISWMTQRQELIVITTQLTTALAILSHAYLAYLTKSYFIMYGVGLMTANIIFLSMPTRYSVLGICGREMFIIGLAVCSFVFAKTVAIMSVDKPGTPLTTNLIFTYWEYLTRMNH